MHNKENAKVWRKNLIKITKKKKECGAMAKAKIKRITETIYKTKWLNRVKCNLNKDIKYQMPAIYTQIPV